MELVNFPPTLVSKVHNYFYLFYSFSSFKPVEKLNWKYVYSLIANSGENYLPYKLYIPIQSIIHQLQFLKFTVI